MKISSRLVIKIFKTFLCSMLQGGWRVLFPNICDKFLFHNPHFCFSKSVNPRGRVRRTSHSSSVDEKRQSSPRKTNTNNNNHHNNKSATSTTATTKLSTIPRPKPTTTSTTNINIKPPPATRSPHKNHHGASSSTSNIPTTKTFKKSPSGHTFHDKKLVKQISNLRIRTQSFEEECESEEVIALKELDTSSPRGLETSSRSLETSTSSIPRFNASRKQSPRRNFSKISKGSENDVTSSDSDVSSLVGERNRDVGVK